MSLVSEPLRPLARQEELVVESLPEEVLVYDLKNNKAHCLSRTAAVVWQHCDGQRSVTELAQVTQQELHTPVEEDVVWFALDQLSQLHLLQERMTLPVTAVSRRELFRRAGAVAAAAVVTTIVAPKAAQAVSCVGQNGNCSGAGVQCCSPYACTGGTCV
ncbi:MAG: PqqD family protein [Abitibacteriaceae bacterium]|nr:PqqD family protein [Abditibacteriaceae bacterium]MBV9868045.1 PqqD family protein [Abditibacteriaceae bacterium]